MGFYTPFAYKDGRLNLL